MLCNYGCGKEAKYQLKNGRWCCSKYPSQCSTIREKNRNGLIKRWKNPKLIEEQRRKATGRKQSGETKKKKSRSIKEAWKDPNSKYFTQEYHNIRSYLAKKQMTGSNHPNYGNPSYNRTTLKKLKKKYPFALTIEEIREHATTKQIQVHCKNRNCQNSKEKGGWFTPEYEQLRSRLNALEREEGNDGLYLYCSEKCKKECVMYNVKGDPFRNKNLPYTSTELEVFNKFVLERDSYICYYCHGIANTVHHTRPQKLEPFFSLDPDYAKSCCINCHYKFGHPKGSKHSTGNLAKIVCF